jgi:GT2 family glycosyltransferase
MNKVVYIIVNYNDSTNTIKLINNIIDYKVIDNIIVVDNKSTDDSLAKLNKIKNNKLKIIENDINKGYSYGLNVGSIYANSQYKNPIIILSNSDIIIESETTIVNLIKHLDDNIKVVMPKIKEKDIFSYGWKLTSPSKDLLMNIPILNKIFRNKYRYYNQEYFNTPTSIIECVYGCFFIIDGKFLESINYFDENVFLYYEEYILGQKVKQQNKLTIIDNNEYVIHNHNTSIGTNISKLNKYKIYKQSQLYYEKNYNKANKLTMILFKIFYYINLIPYKMKKCEK